MKTIAIIATLLSFSRINHGEPALKTYKWHDLLQGGSLPGGTLKLVDGREVLKIENTNNVPLQIGLLTIEQPAITAPIYELTGEIRYDSVQGDGYLELWNYFAPLKPGMAEGQAFSRTLAPSGPLGYIHGTSGWRQFVLPFDSTGAVGAPTRLQLNLVWAGRGTVYLDTIQVIQLPKAKSAADALYPKAWWSERKGGSIGNWGGGIIGCWGGLIGILAAMKKGRSFIIVTVVFMSILGAVALVVGLVAVCVHQPSAVWYPLVLGGILLVTVCPGNLWMYLRKNQEAELRRMQALDASSV